MTLAAATLVQDEREELGPAGPDDLQSLLGHFSFLHKLHDGSPTDPHIRGVIECDQSFNLRSRCQYFTH